MRPAGDVLHQNTFLPKFGNHAVEVKVFAIVSASLDTEKFFELSIETCKILRKILLKGFVVVADTLLVQIDDIPLVHRYKIRHFRQNPRFVRAVKQQFGSIHHSCFFVLSFQITTLSFRVRKNNGLLPNKEFFEQEV